MRIFSILLILMTSTLAVVCQNGGTDRSLTRGFRSVVNEDQGHACILTGPLRLREPALGEQQVTGQYSLFVGPGWRSKALQARKSQLADLLIMTPQNDPSPAIASRSAGENFDEIPYIDKATENLSDLQLQSALAAYYAEHPASRSAENTIFILYLDPSYVSTLAGMTGGKHYVAYHNAFYASGIKLRYAVLPFQEDIAVAARTALNILRSAASDPACGQ